MLGSRSGFQSLLQRKALKYIGLHCMIHRQALASKTLPDDFRDVLTYMIKVVKYLKGSALNTRLFKQLCVSINAEHTVLLFYTKVHRLCKRNVVARVFELQLFIKEGKKIEDKFSSNCFLQQMADLVDMFEHLNILSLKIQGPETTVIHLIDTINAFIQKLENWKRKTEGGAFSSFQKLSE